MAPADGSAGEAAQLIAEALEHAGTGLDAHELELAATFVMFWPPERGRGVVLDFFNLGQASGHGTDHMLGGHMPGRNSLVCLAALLVACGGSDGGGHTGGALLASGDDTDPSGSSELGGEFSEETPEDGETDDSGAPDGEVALTCPKGEVGEIRVGFACDSITVYTCKDLSNVVLEFADGARQRYEGLSGHVNGFSGSGANAGAEVTGVWVKSGSNASGDGPGYGERFDAPSDACTPADGGGPVVPPQGDAGAPGEPPTTPTEPPGNVG